MKIRLIILISAILYAIHLNAQQIDTINSYIEFKVEKLKMITVEGTIRGMHGTIEFDPAQPEKAKFNVCIKPATVKTGIGGRDSHLRSGGFFHVEKYPEICVESTRVYLGDNGFVAEGKLTILGVSKMVTIPFTHKSNTLKGSFMLKRLDYGLGGRTSTFTAANEVNVTIVCILK